MRVSLRVLALHALLGIAWVSLATYCQAAFFDEPSSFFFNPQSEPGIKLSRTREAEVAAHLTLLQSDRPTASIPRQTHHLKKWPKRLCLGILSDTKKRHHTEASLTRTLASLVHGLTPDDRESMHIVVLLATKSPTEHFAFSKPWLPQIADEILVYHPNASAGLDPLESPYHAVEFEVNHGTPPRSKSSIERSRLDHSVLLEACRATQASYAAVIEPDFVATRDWHARLTAALPYVDRAARSRGDDWVYIRAFDTPKPTWNLGVNEWMGYTRTLLPLYAVLVVIGVGLYRWGFHRKGASPKALWQDSLPWLTLGLWIPVFARLYVMAGGAETMRHHFKPYPSGVKEMMREGCCGHGVVFQQRHLEEFQGIFRSPPYDLPVAAILDKMADDRGLSKWGIDPSIMLLDNDERRKS
ncbi:hypothetical protein B0H67DRAFT_117170 [Lasiosphaeris hirsuta]|uniref:Uncharacterized protein n=1 Tax=Lasiosphaeris hirsuta TaxID=260670 RepID=A0AA40AZK6_9PEZI|nr:hypothetical protein B0H67DRAFT_117170 [Lasiosphaeris hirsuta]